MGVVEPSHVTVLAGGVGAARFLRGLIAAIAPEHVTAIVNTGDDTELHGLAISPDHRPEAVPERLFRQARHLQHLSPDEIGVALQRRFVMRSHS